MIILKSRHEIDRMRVSCRIVAEILDGLRSMVCPGITTFDLEKFASGRHLSVIRNVRFEVIINIQVLCVVRLMTRSFMVCPPRTH